MVGVPLGQSTYRRRGARTAEVAVTNMILEKDPTNQVDGLVRFQRPGMRIFANVGVGPIRGIFRRNGVLSSVYLVVSGNTLYSVTAFGVATSLGTIAGNDLVTIDGGATRAVIVGGGNAYSTDGTTLTLIVVPDIDGVDSNISSVAFISGYFILTVANSQHFFWLAPGDVNPAALNFASAENGPDNIVKAQRLLDEVWFFGQQTTELFQITGDIDAPFQPIPGRLYERGCANKDTIYGLDNTLFWVGNDFIVYRADTTPIRISDHSMEERVTVAGANGLVGWAMALEGHTLYILRAGGLGTFYFDVENPNWGRFKSYGQETWRARLGTQIAGNQIIAGDDSTGILWSLDTELNTDNGQPMEREVTGGVTVLGKTVKCRDLSVIVAMGWAPIVGAASNPVLQMRFSDDGGNTWSSWIEASLGLEGQYRAEVVYRQLGIISNPGRIFTLRCTDDVLFRVSYARMNEGNSVQ